MTTREFWAAAAVAFVLVALALADAAVRGALGIPRNDDWVYYRSAFLFAETGRFQPEFASALLFGQILLSWPVVKVFGPVFWPLQVLGSVFGALGLWWTYLLVRGFLPRWAALASVAVLALGPIYLSAATTFMSDPFSYALQVGAMLAAVRAMREPAGRRRWAWVGVALAAALAGFSIREYALAGAGAAILLLLWGQWRAGGRPALLRTLGLCFVWGLAIVALFFWRRSIPGAHATSGTINAPVALVRSAWAGFLTVTLFMASALFFVSPARLLAGLRRVRWWQWAVPLALLLGVTLLLRRLGGAAAFLSNYVFVSGDYIRPLIGSVPYAGTVAGPEPVLFPFEVSSLLAIGAVCVAGVMLVVLTQAALPHLVAPPRLATLLAADPHPARLVVVLFLGVSALGYAAVLVGAAGLFFDRYAMPVVPFVAAIVLDAVLRLGWWSRVSRAVGFGVLAVACAIGVFYVDLAAAFDASKWRIGEVVTDQGYVPASIEGGYEWFGIHQTDEWRNRLAANTEYREAFWEFLFTDRPLCVRVRHAGDMNMVWSHRVVATEPVPSLIGPVGALEAWVPVDTPETCPVP